MNDLLLIITIFICLITDIKNQKIYNNVLFPALIAGIVINIVNGGLIGLKQSLLGFIIGIVFLLIPFIYGGIGGGDVKLLATIGAIKGYSFALYSCVLTGISGGLIALIILIYNRKLIKTLSAILKGFYIMLITKFKVISFEGDGEKIMFPFGIAITIGVAITYAMLW